MSECVGCTAGWPRRPDEWGYLHQVPRRDATGPAALHYGQVYRCTAEDDDA